MSSKKGVLLVLHGASGLSAELIKVNLFILRLLLLVFKENECLRVLYAFFFSFYFLGHSIKNINYKLALLYLFKDYMINLIELT